MNWRYKVPFFTWFALTLYGKMTVGRGVRGVQKLLCLLF